MKLNTHRIAKKTPKKVGFFVAIWKRSVQDAPVPFDESDQIDFLVVAVLENNTVSEFIFSKQILLNKNIFSKNEKGGKRGMRIYLPSDQVTSTQAVETQKWQSNFHVHLNSKSNEAILKTKSLFRLS